MSMMFSNYHSLSELNLLNFDTRLITIKIGIFGRCYNLLVLDLISFDTRKVKALVFIFRNYTKLSKIYASDK